MGEEIRLNDSKLGSQQYWNDFYKREIENFRENEQDTGECWFDDSDAERKVVEFFCALIEEQEIAPKQKVLDLGTGNGHFLFELYDTIQEDDVAADLEYHGVDYSPESVQFACKIAETKYSVQAFTFEHVDFISKSCEYLQANEGAFDILFDKGTLDAIALNNDPVDGFDGKIGTQVYPIQVSKLMHKDSLLFITSCNFTEDELTSLITKYEPAGLQPWKTINYPSFQFGGAKGATVCTVVFKKC